MTDIHITYNTNDGVETELVEDIEWLQVLLNTNKVAVDGAIYHEVSEVEIDQ